MEIIEDNIFKVTDIKTNNECNVNERKIKKY